MRTDEEVDAFVAENHVVIHKIPAVEMEDPMVKFYRARLGNVIELDRPTLVENMMLDRELSFRIVTPAQELKKKN
jgi:DNA-directed RNA polymerase subunit H (RpoH/RPB5)